MSTQPELSISIVTARIPVLLPPTGRSSRRKPAEPRPSEVTLEISTDNVCVWQYEAGMCRGFFPFRRDDPIAAQYEPLTSIPFFVEVFRYVSEQHAANRTNPLGAFLRHAVVAMEVALAERDGSNVYFAEADGRVKIGWSKQVGSRLAQLQVGNAAPIRLLGVEPGGRAQERRLHERFAHARLNGEWFEATPDLCEYVAAVQGGLAA